MSYETDMKYLLSEIESLKNRLRFQERLGTGLGAGWNGVSGWTYASATTITVPSGAASIYAVGDQIRLKQGGGYKYYNVVTVADTLLTVTGGSDYTVANAAITNAAFCKGGGVGHPGYYSYTPTVTYVGGTTNPTSITTNFQFSINGKTLTVNGYGALTLGAGNRTFTIFTLPITTTSICGVSATINYSTGGAVYKYTRVELDKIYVFHNTMNSSDNYYISATCLI